MSSQYSSRRSKRASTVGASSQAFPSSSQPRKRTRDETYNSSAFSSAIQDRSGTTPQSGTTLQPHDEAQQNLLEESDEEDDSEQDQVVMAIDYRQSKMGCSFYNSAEQKLYVVVDMQVNLAGSLNYIGQELFQTREFLYHDIHLNTITKCHS